MIFERVVTEGLAAYSYVVGDGIKAAVIDPRRDIEVYLEIAEKAGMGIAYVFETHRHEDFISGAPELAARTGARIFHGTGDDFEYGYGEPVRDGQRFALGTLVLKALHTPGHTKAHMSYLLYDGETPWILFSGDALFAGDVGRTDFYGPQALKTMSGLLHDSLMEKVLSLGDGVILCPAHGSGSVCGSGISDRLLTTIGIEKQTNPILGFDKGSFIQATAKTLERPPYFRTMERYNAQGAPLLRGGRPIPKPLSPKKVAAMAGGLRIVDTRSELAYAASHIDGAVSIWEKGLPSFAGWFLDYETPIVLVAEENRVGAAVRHLTRLGFDGNLAGYLAGGMGAWQMAGLPVRSMPSLSVQDFCKVLDQGEDGIILDVRSLDELETNGKIHGAVHIHLTELPERWRELPDDRPIHVFCGSGLRAMTGASILRNLGLEQAAVVLGGLNGWRSVSCPIE